MDKLQYQTLDDIERLRTAVGPDRMEHALQKTLEFARLMTYYRCAMMEIETKFKVLNEEFSLRFDRQPINSITTRLKNPLSIQEKLVHKGLPLSLESIERDLHDIAGIRVVCSFIEDVYMGTSKNVKFPLAYHTPPKNQGDFAKKCMNLS